MMEFTGDKPIYKQILDFAYHEITSGCWLPGELIPSVRELSARLGVNTRTVLKAIEELVDDQIVEARRGRGYELSVDAVQRVRTKLSADFLQYRVPEIAAEMERSGISLDTLIEALRHLTP